MEKEIYFSSGADLEWMKKSKNLNFKQNKQEAKNFTEMLKDIDNFPNPQYLLLMDMRLAEL